MLRYFLAAQALRAFSAGPTARKAYRAIGNVAGGRKRRGGISPSYIKRGLDNMAAVESTIALRPGMVVMELGTGWVHWESLFTRLFHDVQIVAMDVWDNRQFDGFKRYCEDFLTKLDGNFPQPAAKVEAARALLKKLVTLDDFEAVYRELGMKYVISPSGSLDFQADNSVDVILSSDVLEHVSASSLPTLAADMMRVLKPGGVSTHQVVPADHLRIYAQSAHPKNYLRYSQSTWENWFDNEVQYVNRVQASEFKRIFEAAGFADVSISITSSAPLAGLNVADCFSNLSREDLECTVFRISGRKPLAN